MNKNEMENRIIELDSLLKITKKQYDNLEDKLNETNSELKIVKHNLLKETIKNEELNDQIVNFEEPFQAAENCLNLMIGMRIEKVITFSNEIKRIIDEKLSGRISDGRIELKTNEIALNSLK